MLRIGWVLTIFLFFSTAYVVDNVQLVTVLRDVLGSSAWKHQLLVFDSLIERFLIQYQLQIFEPIIRIVFQLGISILINLL